VHLASGVLTLGRVHGDRIAVDTTRWVLLIHQVAPHGPAAGPELRNTPVPLRDVDSPPAAPQAICGPVRPRPSRVPSVRRPGLSEYSIIRVVPLADGT